MTTRIWSLAALGLVGLGLLAALAIHVLNSRDVSDVDLRTSLAGAFSARGANLLEPKDGLVCLLVNKNSGRYLSIANGSATRGARIVQGPMPDQARNSERWRLLGNSNGFRLRNESSGLVLEIGSGNRDPGVQAIQWHDQVKVPSQQWIFEPVEDSYVLRAVHSQLVLGIGQSSLEEGGKAVQWHYVPDVPDQCWGLRPANREEVSSDPPQAAPPKAAPRVWLVGGTIAAVVVLLLLAVSLGAELYGRQRRRPNTDTPADSATADLAANADDAAASVSFVCSGCGKRLRVKAVLAGKKVKCPQCGRGVLVPSVQPGGSPAGFSENAGPAMED